MLYFRSLVGSSSLKVRTSLKDNFDLTELGSDYTSRSQGRSEGGVMSGGWRVGEEQLLLKQETASARLSTPPPKWFGFFDLILYRRKDRRKEGRTGCGGEQDILKYTFKQLI